MSQRGAAAALLLLALGAACRHAAPPLAAGVRAELAATPGAYVQGEVQGLEPLAVLDRKDFHYALAWAPRSDAVAFSHLGARDFQLSLWHVGAAQPLSDGPVSGLEFEVEGLAYAPDGRLVAAASRSGQVHLYDAGTGRALAHVPLDEPQVAVAFHPSGRYLVAGGARGRLTVLEVPGLGVISEQRGHADEVRALAFAPDGTLYSGGWDRHIRAWRWAEVLQGPVLLAQAQFPQDGFVNDLSLDARGARLGVALSVPRAERTVDIYRREKAGVKEPLAAHNAALLVDARTGRVLQRWVQHQGVVATAGISPDGRSVASGGWDQQLYVFGEGAQAPRARESFGFSVRRVRFSPDGQLLGVAAWTPQNLAQKSDPAAVLYRVQYGGARVARPQ